MLDGYPPIVAGLERDLDQIEASVFSGALGRFELRGPMPAEAGNGYPAVTSEILRQDGLVAADGPQRPQSVTSPMRQRGRTK